MLQASRGSLRSSRRAASDWDLGGGLREGSAKRMCYVLSQASIGKGGRERAFDGENIFGVIFQICALARQTPLRVQVLARLVPTVEDFCELHFSFSTKDVIKDSSLRQTSSKQPWRQPPKHWLYYWVVCFTLGDSESLAAAVLKIYGAAFPLTSSFTLVLF